MCTTAAPRYHAPTTASRQQLSACHTRDLAFWLSYCSGSIYASLKLSAAVVDTTSDHCQLTALSSCTAVCRATVRTEWTDNGTNVHLNILPDEQRYGKPRCSLCNLVRRLLSTWNRRRRCDIVRDRSSLNNTTRTFIRERHGLTEP